jgi:maleylpyruvate isomerase
VSGERPPGLRLYHYWRSTSSWRVRWALAIKGIACDYVAVSLLDGESESDAHRARNPLGYVPVLEIARPGGEPRHLFESLAIIEWLDETHPAPPLLPRDAWLRARARMLAEIINADTHPLQNLSAQIQHTDDADRRRAWAQHWIRQGLAAYEAAVQETAGRFSIGDELSLADLCLVPQMYNADRFSVALDPWPTLRRIRESAMGTPHYAQAEPSRFGPPKT